MASTYTVDLQCQHCKQEISATINIKIGKSYDSENQLQVSHNELMPIQCKLCGKYTEIRISDVVFNYKAQPLHSV